MAARRDDVVLTLPLDAGVDEVVRITAFELARRPGSFSPAGIERLGTALEAALAELPPSEPPTRIVVHVAVTPGRISVDARLTPPQTEPVHAFSFTVSDPADLPESPDPARTACGPLHD